MDEFHAQPTLTKTKSRWVAFFMIAGLGPFGFIYWGFGAMFTAIACYVGMIMLFGPVGVGLLALVPFLAPVVMETKVLNRAGEKREAERVAEANARAAEERRVLEEQYYANLGMTKAEATLKGDPNAKKHALQLLTNLKAGKLKDALHDLHVAVDPVSGMKASTVREEVKVQEAQKAVAQACCGTCATQNDVGTKYCKECGENLVKAA